jgi:enamine deaminase RidA (YjgF/YER057c/UK114 family)
MMPRYVDIDRGVRGLVSEFSDDIWPIRNATLRRDAMGFLRHVPSWISPSFSKALRIGTPTFICGKVSVPLPPYKGSVSFEQKVRSTHQRIRESLGKVGVGMQNLASIKTYLIDLAPYAVFSRIRGKMLSTNPPTGAAVQVARLLLPLSKIEADAIAFLTPEAAA